MGGGQTIITGVILILLFLAVLVLRGGAYALVTLIAGSIPLILIILGLVLLFVGGTDLKAQKAERAGKTG